MKMKKIIVITLSAIVMLTGCAGTTNGSGSQTSPTPSGTGQNIELGEVSGEITVSAYSQQYRNYLEEAARLFEEQYPDTKINVELFSAMPEVKTSSSGDSQVVMMSIEKDDQAELDYINKINTEIMSGSGADIIAADIIPYYKYIESSLLENLNNYIEADSSFNKNDYRQNVLKAAEYGGGLYILPMDFTFDYIAYDSSLLTEDEQNKLNGNFTFEQLMSLGSTAFERVNSESEAPINMFNVTSNDFFDRLFKLNYDKYVNIEAKSANFTNDSFLSILNDSVEYADAGYIKQGMAGGSIKMDSFSQERTEQILYKIKNSISLLQEYTKDLTIDGPRMSISFSAGGIGNTDNDVVAGMLTSEDGTMPFTYSQAYGISSNSKNKTLSWEFIKFLAGEEMQSSLTLMMNPINIPAHADKTKQQISGNINIPASMSVGTRVGGPAQMNESPAGQTNEGLTVQANEASQNVQIRPENNETDNEPIVLTDEQQEAYDTYMAIFEKMSESLNTLHIQDSTVNSVVISEANYFYDGEKSAGDVASMLQNRVQLYLSE